MPEQLGVSLTDKGIHAMIEDIESGRLVLPDFQRDFVWPTDQVAKLLESLLNGYYINTLLTLPIVRPHGEGAPFPSRRVEGTSDSGSPPLDIQMVLDGQQRVTSIYYAVSAPALPLANTTYPQVFCLRFSKVVADELDEDAITWRRADWEATRKLVSNDFEFQVAEDLVPFTVFKSPKSFTEWRRGMERFADESGKVTKSQIDAFEDHTEVFRNYKVPLIQLSPSTPETKVVRTFERINTQGLELGVFDILTARLWTRDVRLRDLWDSTLADHPRIRAYSRTLGEERLRRSLLRTLALSRGGECKEMSLLELSPENFNLDWTQATLMMDRLLEKAKSSSEGGFGVTEKFGFPYTTMLPPMAALIHLAENTGSYPSAAALEKIQHWYWTSVFSGRYGGSSDTKAYRDYRDLQSWMADDTKTPQSLRDGIQLIPARLNLDSLTRGAAYKGIMSLLVLNRARDFGTFESIDLHEADDHHIFPDSKLERGFEDQRYEDRTTRNRILNRTIIEARGNRFRYRDELPGEYLPKLIEDHPEGETGMRELLLGHFISDKGFEALLENDYLSFCHARKAEIQSAIQARVGAHIRWATTEQMTLEGSA